MLDLDPPPAPSRRARAAGATWVSASVHVAVAVVAALITQRSGGPSDPTPTPTAPLVWVDRAGDDGGRRAGGGREFGNRTQQPPPVAKRAGADRRTVPATPPPSFEGTVSPIEPRVQQITVPVVPEASGLRDIPGTVSIMPVTAASPGGPGTSRGAGDGDHGTGLDRGPGHHIGSGPGSGTFIPPEVIRQVRPNYTSAALQARLRGLVVMDAVVLPDGSVGEVRIVRSLDRQFGLDQEAINAVRQWRFRAGTRGGKPIATLVSVEMLFELR